MAKKDEASEKDAKKQAKRVAEAEKQARKAAKRAKVAREKVAKILKQEVTKQAEVAQKKRAARKAERVAERLAALPVHERQPSGPVELRERAEVPMHFSDLHRFRPGDQLAAIDPAGHPGWEDKDYAQGRLDEGVEEIAELQERLFAQATAGNPERLLLLVQGMDTSGKGGIMRHVVGAMDPQGVQLTSFKAPTEEERRHDFLWRIRNAMPKPGRIGVFDRSQYEDVLIVRVHDLVPEAEWSKRYDLINAFEAEAAASGTTIVKVMLHISKAEQGERLRERIVRDDKHWKYNPGDITERESWDAYQEAYQALLERCSTDAAPWFVVPADHKWYARLAVQQIVLEHLQRMDPQWPAADFDIETEKARLAASS